MKILHKSIRIKNKRYNEKLNKAMHEFVGVLDKYRGVGGGGMISAAKRGLKLTLSSAC